MTDRTIITLNDGTFAIAERQDNYAFIGRYITTTVVRLSADDCREIAGIVERAERRNEGGHSYPEIAKARDYLARHAPELLAFKPEGIDHG